MFGKLFSRQSARSDHPLGKENLAERIASIPRGNPERLLFEVDELLESLVDAFAELGGTQTLAAALALDDHAHPGVADLLERYLTPGKRDYLGDLIWTTLEVHYSRVFAAYRTVLLGQASHRDVMITKGQLARIAARALRAWGEKGKLQRFRYRPLAENHYQQAHELLRSCAPLDILQSAQAAYPGDADSSAVSEYLAAIYLELSPLGNLVPPQIEAAHRFLRTIGGLVFSTQMPEQCTHTVDLASAAGPRRHTPEILPGGMRYFLSVHKARSSIMMLARESQRGDTRPAWLNGLSLSTDQSKGVVHALVEHWAPTPPQRGAARQEVSIDMRAVFGFDLVRRMIAYSMFARSGRQLKYEGADFTHYYDKRFGRVDEDEREPEIAVTDETDEIPLTPMEILQKFEVAGDKLQMEIWRQVDSSENGTGVTVPALRPRHEIGALVAMRQSESIEWQAAIIRRIGRDAQGRPGLGLQALDFPSYPALAKLQGDADLWVQSLEGGNGWIDAVLASSSGNQVLLPAFAFAEGRDIKLRSDEGIWSIRMRKLLDRGTDYDRIEFERIS